MNILVVNDEPVQRYRIASLLRKEGYQVKEAEDGMEALNLLEEGFDPSLIITDLYMPRLDGWQLCRYVRERGLQVPILVISAFFEFKEIAEILGALGVEDFLRSPIKQRDLLEKVRGLLSGRAKTRKPQEPSLLFLSDSSVSYETLVRALRRAGFAVTVVFGLEEAKEELHAKNYPLALVTTEYTSDDLLSLKQHSPSTSFAVLYTTKTDEDPFRFVLKGARHVIPSGSSPEFVIYLLQRELKEQALLLGQELLRQRTRELELVSQELHRIQNVLQTVVEQAADIGIIVTDEKMNPFFANPKAQEFFALSPENDFWGLLQIAFGHTDLSEIRKTVEEKGGYHCEVRIPEKEEILTFKLRPLKEKGKIAGFVFFIEDVTRERELHSRLLQMQKMEAIATLAAGIAHDFNNLLAAIRLKAELLRDKIDNGYRNYIQDIMSICDRAAQVVRQIISFSHPKKTSEITDLNQQVHEALEFLRETVPRGIRLQVELHADPIPVNLDAGKLSQIVLNLCLNAVQAMGEEGTLLVRTGREKYEQFRPPGFLPGGGAELSGEYGWLEVRDTGCGIRPEHLPKIFDPYFTTKQDQAGTGLGLAVTYGLVSNAGGVIAVETALQQGTTFYIYLPVAREPDLADILEGLHLEADFGARVLVVEDEAVIREAMVEYLNKKGYDTRFCENGSQALGFLSGDWRPEVVILDLNLPGMSGPEVARRLKQEAQDIAILAITGFLKAGDREILDQIGVEGVLLKPFSLEYLHENLKHVLARQREETDHVHEGFGGEVS